MASIYLTQNEWFQSPALGDVDMGGNTIENLAAPVDASDAVTKQYADSLAGGINPSQWSMFPAVSDVNMNLSSIYGVKQISNSAGLVLSGTDNFADANHRITVATSGISVNSVNLTGNVNITSGENTTITANANVAQTNGVLTLQNKTNAAYLTSSGLGLGVSNPTAKLEVVQDAGADCVRVLDSNTDTTFFKIDSNGNVGVGMGSAALTYPFNVAGKALLIDNVAPNPELIFSGSVAGVDCLASVTARNGSSTDRSLQFYNAKNIGSSNAAFSFLGGDGTTNPAFQILGNKTSRFFGAVDMNGQTLANAGGLGVGTATPTAKLEVVQDAGADCLRVYDSNADTTFFKIDSNGNCSVNAGANATATKTLNVGYGGSDSNSALKFNSGANDKIFWTFYDTGPKTSILNDFILQTDLGSLGHPNYGSEIWRTMGPTDYIERMRLTNAGNLGLGTSTPTAKLEVVQDAAADCVRVLDSNADTTFFKIDSNGFVGVNCGASASANKAFNIGYGSADTGANVSALKFNSADGDKLFLTYLDGGSKISQLSSWGFGLSAGHVSTINQGYFSFRTMGGTLGAEPVERMRLENNGQLNTMTNKIINVGTPTVATDAANKSYVDSISGSNSAGWSLNPATSNINAASYKIINLGAAVNAGDAVNVAYLGSNYFNPKGGNCHYVEASIDSPGTDYTVDLGSSPFNDIYVNVCLKTGYTKNIYWTNNNNTNLQGRRVHVSVSGTSDAAASGKCYYLDGSGSYYDISLNSSNRILVFVFLKGYTGLNDLVLESSRAS